MGGKPTVYAPFPVSLYDLKRTECGAWAFLSFFASFFPSMLFQVQKDFWSCLTSRGEGGFNGQLKH